jgi:nicotinate-nucleotide adenylyltransferase
MGVVGILGGTFDPIHLGHLAIAEDCWEQLGLERVLFVPAGQPPHKRGRAITSAADRVAMVELAIADNPHFALSRVDVDRPGPSYSVEMLRAIQAEQGSETDLFFIVGQDSLLDLPSWREPEQLIRLCRLAVVRRPGYRPIDLARLEAIIPNLGQRLTFLETPALDLSSSELRRRVAAGRPIRYLVPDAVRRYIAERGLYRERDQETPSP